MKIFIHRLRRFTQIMQGKIAESKRDFFAVQEGNKGKFFVHVTPNNKKTALFSSSESVTICAICGRNSAVSSEDQGERVESSIHRLRRFTQIMQGKIAGSRKDGLVVQEETKEKSFACIALKNTKTALFSSSESVTICAICGRNSAVSSEDQGERVESSIHRLRRFTQIMQGKIAESKREFFVVQEGNKGKFFVHVTPNNKKTALFFSSESVTICAICGRNSADSSEDQGERVESSIHRLRRFTQIMQGKIAESRKEGLVVQEETKEKSFACIALKNKKLALFSSSESVTICAICGRNSADSSEDQGERVGSSIHRLRRFAQIMQGKIAESKRDFFVVQEGNKGMFFVHVTPNNKKTALFFSSESVTICAICGRHSVVPSVDPMNEDSSWFSPSESAEICAICGRNSFAPSSNLCPPLLRMS